MAFNCAKSPRQGAFLLVRGKVVAPHPISPLRGGFVRTRAFPLFRLFFGGDSLRREHAPSLNLRRPAFAHAAATFAEAFNGLRGWIAQVSAFAAFEANVFWRDVDARFPGFRGKKLATRVDDAHLRTERCYRGVEQGGRQTERESDEGENVVVFHGAGVGVVRR